MSRYTKLGKDLLVMIIGSFGSKILNFLIVPFYTAILTTEEYGISDLIVTISTLLLPFFTLVVYEALMRFALEKTNDPGEVWNVGCKVTVWGSLIFLALSPIVLFTPLKEQFWYFVAYYLMYSVNQSLSYFVRGINKVKVFALSGVIQTLVVVTSNVVLLAYLKLGIEGYLISLILGAAVSTVYMIFAAKVYKFGFSIRVANKKLEREMLKYCIPLIPNSASWWFANTASRFFLTVFIDVSATGIFSVAYKIPNIMSVVTTIFGRAWKINSVEDFGSDASKKFFESVFSKLTMLLVMAVSLLMLVNKPLSALLYKNDFYQAWQIVPFLLLSSIMHTYSEFFCSVFTSVYKTKYLIISTISGAVLNVVANIILIPLFGLTGAAVANLLGQSCIFVVRLIKSRDIMKLDIDWKREAACFIALSIQLLVAIHSFRYEYIFSAVIFVFLLVLLRKDIFEMCSLGLKKLKSKKAGK